MIYNSLVSDNYTVYDVLEPSKLILRPDDVIGNFDGMLRGFMETPGREPQSSYNDLVTIKQLLLLSICVRGEMRNTRFVFFALSSDFQHRRQSPDRQLYRVRIRLALLRHTTRARRRSPALHESERILRVVVGEFV